jgi:hypothetical protein
VRLETLDALVATVGGLVEELNDVLVKRAADQRQLLLPVGDN